MCRSAAHGARSVDNGGIDRRAKMSAARRVETTVGLEHHQAIPKLLGRPYGKQQAESGGNVRFGFFRAVTPSVTIRASSKDDADATHLLGLLCRCRERSCAAQPDSE